MFSYFSWDYVEVLSSVAVARVTRWTVNIDGVSVLYFCWGYVQNEDPGQIRW